MRLNQYLAQSLGVSRRGADEIIKGGRVQVNGQPGQLGYQVSEGDLVTFDGTSVVASEHQTIMLNKPAGYVSSRQQQGSSKTIYSLLPDELWRLKPVGRLDKDSSGLLLLTSDGQLAHKLMHPSMGKWKRYEIEVNTPLSEEDLKRLNEGVELDDGMSRMQIKKLNRYYEILLQEGRNRQIRRSIEAVGKRVTRLHRTSFGKLELGKLKPGQWREITGGELA